MNYEEEVRKVLKESPTIETRRLILRPIEMKDADSVFQMRSDEKVGQFIGRDMLRRPEEAVDIIKESIESFQQGKAIGWVARLKGSEQDGIIGTCGFSNLDYEQRKAELTGEMAVVHWGKYYAMEGTLAVISFGFNKLHLRSIESVLAPDNESAIYLLEKLGFSEERQLPKQGVLNGKPVDLVLFSKKNAGA